ncbi:hypothetical protein A2210_01760 [Candidatus Woesebacteria bacterium RIFOXYA1_FULL_40_18]|uniref:Glycosyltransferase RgtA/B/C/D-like domain-containing protein n=3 Tax=Candidatus Woeseibacteriota TaxID=1752722 RepID=A0A0G0SL99_9BACT|nr:MAG: hypothetical protein UT72_C0013G0004 [Candidatus Woesebacteria bacterium GW2011_GWB1_40_101]KKR63126.1 MAG: hypothetical protein UU03_C0011G0007 [Candidatus Woesebacteria bacterium GW2011_GWA1_40_45]OGM76269.1 MAG: hypothetical protein A2210_01760 [Candidatus Woesebacteria bacterium RIFOXYA1_FULL_40_18]
MFKKIALSFVGWRVALFIFAFLSIYLLPAFGARFPYADRVLEITHLPYWIWGWGNFDGVHYLRIAQDGYLAQYSQAFFPFYPLLVRIFSFIFPKIPNLDTNIFTDPSYFYSGLILSNIFFLASLFVFYKLLEIDFKKSVAVWSIIFLLAFPTSFYFSAVYTESLFLFLTVLSIYLIRKGKFFGAAILISLASATRIFGLLLIPLYLIEVLKSKKYTNLIWLIFAPLGTILYMYFLKVQFNNAFYFLTSQPIFGAQRTSGQIVLLPQVIFRYIKIFLTTNPYSLAFFNAVLEFLFTLVPLTVLLFFYKKMRFSYWLFSLLILILPSLTGTFSSMPRYALMGFLLIPYIVSELKNKIPILIAFSLLAFILVTLFIRGYWVA